MKVNSRTNRPTCFTHVGLAGAVPNTSPASHETGLTCRLRNSDNNIVLFYFILLSYSCSVYHYQLKVPFQGLYSYFFSTILIILKLQLDLTYNRFPKLKSCRLASWSSQSPSRCSRPSSKHIPRLKVLSNGAGGGPKLVSIDPF